jgi:monofunctional biosynthetic peptidoglycan transglycosylase
MAARISGPRSYFKRILFILAVPLLLLAAAGAYLLFLSPEIERLQRADPKTTAFIEARRRESLQKGQAPALFQRSLPLLQISPHLQRAVIISEDGRFYQHEGFDWDAIMEAAELDWEEGSFRRGGSTISQQLAKNLFLSSRKNPLRKIKEMLITWLMEKKLTKRRILEIYLNWVEWGEGIYGAEAAAQRYFSKSAGELTRPEAAFLAAILPAPRYYQRRPPTRFLEKKIDLILERLQKRYPETDPAE